MEVLLLGHPKSKTSRKAQRFFSDRRVPVHDRDLRKRAASPRELNRWIQRFGVDGVLDTSATTYDEQGLRYLSADPDEWVDRFAADPLLLRLPLVRYGEMLAVGDDPDRWQEIADASQEE